MSVKVRLNNKKFLGGNSLLIGSHLYENKLFEEEVSQDANAQGGAANPTNTTTTPSTTPTANSATPTATPTATPDTNTTTPVEQKPIEQPSKAGDNQNQQSIADQLTTVLTNGFKQFTESLKNQIVQIKFPEGVQAQWKAPEAPKDETLQSQLDVLKGFIEGNVNVVKTVIEQQQKASQEQSSATNASTGA